MATVVSGFTRKKRTRNGFFSGYADGRIWKLTPEDYGAAKVISVRADAYRWAKVHGFLVYSEIVGDAILLQFTPKAQAS
jgi:hypothetical protein